jgi:hypothetical protein
MQELPGGLLVPLEDETDPLARRTGEEEEPADREERRVQALQRLIRRSLEEEKRVGGAFMRKVPRAVRGEPPED